MFVNGCDVRSLVKNFFSKGFNSKEREAIKPRKKKRNKKKKRKIEIKFTSFFSVFVIDLGFSC